MIGIWEDKEGNLYKVRCDAELTNVAGNVLGTRIVPLVIYSPLHVDRDNKVLAMVAELFNATFRRLSPSEVESRIWADMKAHRERWAEHIDMRWTQVQIPKDAELARPLK